MENTRGEPIAPSYMGSILDNPIVSIEDAEKKYSDPNPESVNTVDLDQWLEQYARGLARGSERRANEDQNRRGGRGRKGGRGGQGAEAESNKKNKGKQRRIVDGATFPGDRIYQVRYEDTGGNLQILEAFEPTCAECAQYSPFSDGLFVIHGTVNGDISIDFKHSSSSGENPIYYDINFSYVNDDVLFFTGIPVGTDPSNVVGGIVLNWMINILTLPGTIHIQTGDWRDWIETKRWKNRRLASPRIPWQLSLSEELYDCIEEALLTGNSRRKTPVKKKPRQKRTNGKNKANYGRALLEEPESTNVSGASLGNQESIVGFNNAGISEYYDDEKYSGRLDESEEFVDLWDGDRQSIFRRLQAFENQGVSATNFVSQNCSTNVSICTKEPISVAHLSHYYSGKHIGR